MLPVIHPFFSMNWRMGSCTDCTQRCDLKKTGGLEACNECVLQIFKSCQLPVIALSPDTSHEAV